MKWRQINLFGLSPFEITNAPNPHRLVIPRRCPDFQTSLLGSDHCICEASFSNTSSTSSESCTCAPGHTLSNGFCVVCLAGSFKEDFGNGPCSSCDQAALPGSFSTWHTIFEFENKTKASFNPPISRHNCTCEPGYFNLPSSSPSSAFVGECLKCPDDAGDCTERGVALATLPLKDGTWRSSPDSIEIEFCYSEHACVQPDDPNEITAATTDYQCAEGHTGPLCNVCEPNHVKSVTGECLECKPTTTGEIERLLLMRFASLSTR
jgi:hypothetical protein